MQKQGHDFQLEKVKQLNKYQDILDVFIHIMMLRLPTAFVLINMTLMIWLVQTIFSSFSADTVPRSLYLLSPLLISKPIISIQFSKLPCNETNSLYQTVLKTIPGITIDAQKPQNLTKWRESSNVCIKKSQKQSNFSQKCEADQIFCTGLCVQAQNQCPITGIRKINSMEIVMPSEQVFYKSIDGLYKYVLSRQNKTNYIADVKAQYEYRCANQYHYFDTFKDFGTYWNATKDCGSEGFISAQIYRPFDTMKTQQFLFTNGIWSQSITNLTRQSTTELGTMNKIQYKKTAQCSQFPMMAQTLFSSISSQPQPLFSKTLLIISFIFFTLCWSYLLAFYCCQANTHYKPIFVFILALTEFITFSFIYHQNTQILQLQNIIKTISLCIDQPSMTSWQNWSFGLADRRPLIAILYVSACFGLMSIFCFLIDFFMYEKYYYGYGAYSIREFSLDAEDSYISVEEDD